MYQVLGVGRGKATGDFDSDAQNFIDRQRSMVLNSFLKRGSLDKFHHQERNGIFFDGVNLDGVVVTNPCCCSRFVQELLSRLRQLRVPFMQNLDRDVALQFVVESF